MYIFYILPLQTLKDISSSLNNYENNPWHTIAFFTGISIITVIIIFLNISKTVRNSNLFTSGRIGNFDHKSRYDISILNLAKFYCLKRQETLLLKKILNASRYYPEQVFSNTEILDSVFKSYYERLEKGLENSPAETLRNMKMLFLIRDTIAYFQNNSKAAVGRKRRIPRNNFRKQVNFQCTCTSVSIVKTREDGKTVKKFQLEGTGFRCVVLDISSGGCAVRSFISLKAGSRVKIEFKTGKSVITALGQIIRVNTDVRNIIFHIRFIKIQPKTFCRLNAYIFGYL
jgi:hypothetical protein